MQLPGLDYYIEAVDAATVANHATLPAAGSGDPFSFTVSAVDTAGPSIVHTPVADDRPEGVAVTVEAVVTDPSGVADVRLYLPGQRHGHLPVRPHGRRQRRHLRRRIPAELIHPPGVDYYLEAVDAAPGENTSLEPATAPTLYHAFTVATLARHDRAPHRARPHRRRRPGRPGGERRGRGDRRVGRGAGHVELPRRRGRRLPRAAHGGLQLGIATPRQILGRRRHGRRGRVLFPCGRRSRRSNAAVDPSDAPTSLYRFTPAAPEPTPSGSGCGCASAGGAGDLGGGCCSSSLASRCFGASSVRHEEHLQLADQEAEHRAHRDEDPLVLLEGRPQDALELVGR